MTASFRKRRDRTAPAGFALEDGRQRLQRHLRRHVAFGVAAHAVGQREQAGVRV